jgi:hypothetical protein
VSKLFDKLKNAARSRSGGAESPIPSPLLSHALRRASDERAALRAASPAGAEAIVAGDDRPAVIDMEAVDVARIEAEVQAQERLSAAARERAEAEELALQAARLRLEAEERATELAKEREQTERSAAREARERAQVYYKRNPAGRSRREDRRLKRGLLLALAALAIVAGVIFARTYMPELFGEHGAAPVFKLDRELKTAPASGK